jgi:DNA-binding NtrC family response regulator
VQWASAVPEEDGPVVGCAAMEQVYATARRLASKTLPVLLMGETGTGKELVARAIHQGGARRRGPLVSVNCAAIPQTLIESELFGHERGAFTGASQRAKGVFEEADGGSVFLDEIGELSAAGQAALLRVLDTKRFCRVGSQREIAVDVRLIAATNRDLEAMSEGGAFRLDLLHRINAMTLEIPPLRTRGEEIPVLVEHFVAEAARENRCDPRTLAPEAMALLLQYDWPGNVRELRNVIERGMALATGATIEVEHLPGRLLRAAAAPGAPPVAVAGADDPLGEIDRLIDGPRGPGATGFRTFIHRTEAAVIAEALALSDWKKTAVAERLGIPLRTLNDKLSAHGIDRQFEGEAELARALEQAVPAEARQGFRQRIQRYEAVLIGRALRRLGGRRNEVAKALGIPERTLRDKLRAYGLD